MIVKFLKYLLRWFLPECSRCGGVMLYDNTHSWHDKWHLYVIHVVEKSGVLYEKKSQEF